MDLIAKNIINICWSLFLIVWVLAAIFTKRTVHRESRAQRLRYTVPIVIGCLLLFREYRLPYPLNLRIIPHTDTILLAATILCLCGIAFCFWARAILGRNWSGTVTLKEDHELVVRGPYQLVRHPIYTGLLAMCIATAMQQGRIAGIIGLMLVSVSFWIKLSEEERFMLRQFPDRYPAYQRHTKRIIPFVL